MTDITQRQSHINLDDDCILPEKPYQAKSRKALIDFTGKNPGRNWDCCHLCDNDSRHGGCINPLHLYWGTRSENMCDASAGYTAEQQRRKAVMQQKKSESMTGKPKSDEHRQHLSESMTGKSLSDQHRQHMSESAKRRWAKHRQSTVLNAGIIDLPQPVSGSLDLRTSR